MKSFYLSVCLKAELRFLRGSIGSLNCVFRLKKNYIWRSGIKHDCTKVMELKTVDGTLCNGFGEIVDIEDNYIFPLLKSSDISNGRINSRGFMLVTQQTIGEDTTKIRTKAPKTWTYLESYASLLQKRSSSIYRNKPAFSIFGVGDYSFTSWKIAISGFYKKINFTKVGPVSQRPAVFDDTVYFLSRSNEEEAEFLFSLLNSEVAREFYRSMIFWADKRPITIELLKRLSIEKLAIYLGKGKDYEWFNRKTNKENEDKEFLTKTSAHNTTLLR